MKLLLLCLGLTLLCAHGEGNDVVRSNFDLEKLSGKWYSILLASDKKEKIEENGSMKVFVERIRALKDSSLSFKFHTHVNGECTAVSLVADKKDGGVYGVEYDGYNVFHIVETDYVSYAIFQLRNFKSEESFQLLELYGREPDVSPEIKKRFEEFSKENGIGEQNIIDLTNVDRCLQARDGK
ncbi:PREDICTED: allergen Fel d 4-like [Chinchilla lanigera]|uniref:Allergen Fel d 4-like n=1 Tax=Chinchilla lanigera TaxID=34839 RepID=A0A8C2VHA7_CHILA|nr:PREDICTED: allergen Fel d 4-like [Chinchilla lanigera]